MNEMTVDEAKRIVLERFPNSHSRQYDGTLLWVILRDHSPFYITISEAVSKEGTAWLSAAQRIIHERKS